MENNPGMIKIESDSNEILQNKNTKYGMYRGQTPDVSEKISELVAEKMLLLTDVAKRGKTNLRDLEEVKAVSIGYMEACRRSGTLPNFEGLCVSMGYSRQWLYQFMRTRESNNEIVAYLEELRTLFADMITTASLRRYVDCATTIFSLKNMTGLGYSDKGDSVPEAQADTSEHDSEYYVKMYENLLEE